MTAALVLDALVLAWVLYRQLQVRRVWMRLTLRLPVVLGLIGIVEIVDFSHQHPIHAAAAGVLALSLLIAGAGFGALRALTVRLWSAGGVVLRQGTWVTMTLWLVSLGLHFAADAWVEALKGPAGLTSASLLLYLGVTYGVQQAVVHHRAMALAHEGEPIDVQAQEVPGRWWAGTFRTGPGGGPGAGRAPWGQFGTVELPRWPFGAAGNETSAGAPDGGGGGPLPAIDARAEVVEQRARRGGSSGGAGGGSRPGGPGDAPGGGSASGAGTGG